MSEYKRSENGKLTLIYDYKYYNNDEYVKETLCTRRDFVKLADSLIGDFSRMVSYAIKDPRSCDLIRTKTRVHKLKPCNDGEIKDPALLCELEAAYVKDGIVEKVIKQSAYVFTRKINEWAF